MLYGYMTFFTFWGDSEVIVDSSKLIYLRCTCLIF